MRLDYQKNKEIKTVLSFMTSLRLLTTYSATCITAYWVNGESFGKM